MRLTEDEVDVIKTAILRRFGSVHRIVLFGSRVDDEKRGGDIDLFVESEDDTDKAVLHKIEALGDIQLKLGERKIDMIVTRPDGCTTDKAETRTIVRIARETGVVL
jgi:predicted nucleotidyltransferase